jgi:hypothetical protein
MPMLHSCSFPGCETRTLTPYCLEHEVLIRAKARAEREQALGTSNEPVSAEAAEVANAGLSAA